MADKRKNLGRTMKSDTELIAGFKKREKKLRAKLKEKDTLIKEIHHCVRNNIQIISSLIRLQASTIQDEKLAEVLKSTQGRIRSISLIHEKLSQSRDFGTLGVRVSTPIYVSTKEVDLLLEGVDRLARNKV